MTIQLSDLKIYLRIDFDSDNHYLTHLLEVAKSFIKEQTNVEYISGDKVYEQAILFLSAHFYDNRSIISEKATPTNVPYTIEELIRHIKLRGAITVVQQTTEEAELTEQENDNS